jgi:predicted PP-loop superfamily ATPase
MRPAGSHSLLQAQAPVPPLQEDQSMADKRVNKVVLAYSGGLDTSIILKWLQNL